MAMKIEREGTGFRIRLTGDRDRIVARNESEIATAVEHYFGAGPAGWRAHEVSGSFDSECPLCRVAATKRRTQ